MPTSLAPGVARNDGALVAVEGDLGVGVVVHDEDLVGAGELDHALEEPLGHDRAGRVVGVVEVHQLGLARDVLVDRAEVGDEAELGLERHQHGLGACEPRAAGVDGVAGVGGERVVAGVEEGEVEVEDRLLGADRGDDLASRGRARRRSGARRSRARRHGSRRGRGWTGTGACRPRSRPPASPRRSARASGGRGRRCRG